MTDQPATQPTFTPTPNRRFWLIGAVIVILLLLALWALLPGDTRPLKPIRPTATAVANQNQSQPILLTFAELNERPYDYINQRIRVSGSLTHIAPPNCTPSSSPNLRWGLLATSGDETLQLPAQGFEDLVRRAPDGLSMTIEGIWQLYDGPLGCGKGPAPGIAWYLAVERILQPNPFPPGTIAPGVDQPTLPDGTTATPDFVITPISPTPSPVGNTAPETTATATATPTRTTSPTPSATASGALSTPGTPAPTATLTATRVGGSAATATATRTRTTATATSQSGAATPTLSRTPTASPTPGSYSGPPTATPGGFITATPGSGYPNPPTTTPGSGYP